MRFGLCCSVEDARQAAELGVDYVEVAAVGFNGSQPSWNRSIYEGLPIEAANVFFPGAIKLVGPSRTDYREYARRTVERAAEVGVKVMVVGSGASRAAPDGYDPIQAEAEFVDVVAELQEIAEPFGIAIAPESLNREETNVGNDLGRLARSLAERGLAFTADSYHVLKEWARLSGSEEPPPEGPSEAFWREQIPRCPAHVHIGDLARNAPRADDPMMRGFAESLKQVGYKGRVSLECRVGDLRTGLPAALRQLRALFA